MNKLSRDSRNPVFGTSTWSDTNRPVQSQKQARSLKFRIYEEEKLLYYLYSDNRGADTAKLSAPFRIGKNPFFLCFFMIYAKNDISELQSIQTTLQLTL